MNKPAWSDDGTILTSGFEKYPEKPPSPFPLIVFLHKICNVILPSTRRSSEESLCFMFPYKTPARDFLLPPMSKMPCPSHPFDLNTGKYTVSSKAHNYAIFPSIPCLPLLSPCTFPSTFSKILIPRSSLRSETNLHTHTQ